MSIDTIHWNPIGFGRERLLDFATNTVYGWIQPETGMGPRANVTAVAFENGDPQSKRTRILGSIEEAKRHVEACAERHVGKPILA